MDAAQTIPADSFDRTDPDRTDPDRTDFDRTDLDRTDLERAQLESLRSLVDALTGRTPGTRPGGNPFWAPRLRAAGLGRGVDSLAHFVGTLPLITKAEIVDDQRACPPYGTNLTFPRAKYVRVHQTSGTTGTPLRWLDTEESWRWMLDAWRRVFSACGVEAGDRIVFAFSFGPFLGFWTAFDAAGRHGCLAIPGGGATSKGRLQLIVDHDADAVCCTPTYALRLAEVAAEEGLDLSRVERPRKLIVAGEPGGGLPAVRRRLSEAWGGAVVYDHHGMTEVGPVTTPDPERPGVLRILERSYLAEILDLESGRPAAAGEVGELVLTTLGRVGSPLLRYRTGDLVRTLPPAEGAPPIADLPLDGGILARTDDMVVVRGVNLYPSAVDRVVRAFDEVAEYRVTLRTDRSMTEAELEIEPAGGAGDVDRLAARVREALRAAFQIRMPVRPVEVGALPRFELKASRWRRLDQPTPG